MYDNQQDVKRLISLVSTRPANLVEFVPLNPDPTWRWVGSWKFEFGVS